MREQSQAFLKHADVNMDFHLVRLALLDESSQLVLESLHVELFGNVECLLSLLLAQHRHVLALKVVDVALLLPLLLGVRILISEERSTLGILHFLEAVV